METLLLTRADVARHLEALSLLQALREGFARHSSDHREALRPARAPVGLEGSSVVVFPGLVPGVPAFSVRSQADFPRSDPPSSGVLQLFDRSTGEILAVMESGQLIRLRTGLAAALSADVLARTDASKVALVGAGRQSRVALKCLRLVRSLAQVRIYDPDPARAEALAQETYQSLALPARAVPRLEEALEGAHLVVCATRAFEPLLYPGMVANGCHVISLGGDEPGKVELSASLVRQSKYFCDDRGLTLSSGTLATLGMGEESIAAELGEVISGTLPGRSSPEEVTLFTSVGLAFEDLLAAWSVYESAKQDESVRRIDFRE